MSREDLFADAIISAPRRTESSARKRSIGAHSRLSILSSTGTSGRSIAIELDLSRRLDIGVEDGSQSGDRLRGLGQVCVAGDSSNT